MIGIVSAADCGESITCYCGDTLTSSYTMTSDLTNCPADGIIIGAGNVILDCQGHTINGNNPGYPYSGINNGGEFVDGWSGGYDNVTIKNCIITGGFYNGIMFVGASYGNIINNTASSNEYGFHVFWNSIYDNLINNTATNNTLGFRIAYTSYDTLVGNIANNNNYGIGLDASSYINVVNNTANDNNYLGIAIANNNYNNLTNNIANNNHEDGINLVGADYSNIINNTVNNNGNGITIADRGSYNNIINNTATDNTNGINLYYSDSSHPVTNNTFTSNILDDNSNANVYFEGFIIVGGECTGGSICSGLMCSGSQFECEMMCGCTWIPGEISYPAGNNNFIGNTLTGATYGFEVKEVTSNAFADNMITGNSYGISLNTSSNNMIYNNYFSNSVNAVDNGNNFWNATKTAGTNIIGGPFIAGNFWSDYIGTDSNGDGLGDTNLPYNSNGNILIGGDYLPLLSNLAPVITILSPVNSSYYHKLNVSLNFSIDKNTSWIGYSLNNTLNVTILGPVNMTGLSDKWNNVKVFANDTSGNMGASETRYFFYCYGDINHDKRVDMKDVGFAAKLFGCNCPNACYYGTTAGIPNSEADLNNDCKIDMKDISAVSRLFGKNCY